MRIRYSRPEKIPSSRSASQAMPKVERTESRSGFLAVSKYRCVMDWATSARHCNRLVAAWLGLFSLLLYIGTARGTLSFGDDASMLGVTRSIATHASFAVPPGTPGASPGIDGRYYSKYGLGQSALAVPFYLVGRFVYERSDAVLRNANPDANPITYCACLLGIVSGAATVVLLYLTCISLGFGQFASAISTIAFGASTFAWFYARTFMTEPTSTFFLVLAFYALLSSTQDSGLFWLFVSGFGLGVALLVRLQNSIVLPVFAASLIWMVRASGRNWKTALRAVTVWAAPILASFAVITEYNYLRFGNPLDTGFNAQLAPFKLAQFIFQTPLYVGLYGLLLSPGKGMLWYAPVLIPALYGWRFLWQRNSGATTVMGTLAVTYLLFYAPVTWWFGGGCWGPRFMVEILPFLMIGFAALIDHGLGLIGWSVVGALSTLSFFIQLPSILVSYVPYIALMKTSPGGLARTLWNPAYSPIIVQTKYLLRHTYPYDLAYNAYPSTFLGWLQFGSLAAALVVFCAGTIFYFRMMRCPKQFEVPECPRSNKITR
jgi:hypothetical protein